MRDRHRQRIPKVDEIRHFMGGQPGRGPGLELGLIRLDAVSENHDGNDLILQQSSRYADGGGSADRWVCEQGILNLGRRDVFAAAADHVFESPGQEYVAVRVAEA